MVQHRLLWAFVTAFALVSLPFGFLITANQTNLFTIRAAVLSPATYTPSYPPSVVTQIDEGMRIAPLQSSDTLRVVAAK